MAAVQNNPKSKQSEEFSEYKICYTFVHPIGIGLPYL